MKKLTTFGGIFLIALLVFFLELSPSKTSAHLAITTPVGGECLTVGQSYTIRVEFDGGRAALYYRSDGEKPVHLDSSLIKYPLTVKTFVWAPQSRHISEAGRIWLEELNEADETKAWQNSSFDFVVRKICPKNADELAVIKADAELRGWQRTKAEITMAEEKITNSSSEEKLLALLAEIYELKKDLNKVLLPPRQLGGTTLITGDLELSEESEEIKTLQRVLAKFPEIYKESSFDGIFSSSTEAALRRFQSIFKIAALESGKVGSETRFRLNTLINSKTHVITKDSEGRFNPATLTIETGDIIRWFNNGFGETWPTSDDHPTHAKYPERGGCVNSLFDACRAILPEESYYFVFNVNGTWSYHDHLNPDLKGKIIVK